MVCHCATRSIIDNGTFVEFQMVLPDGKHFIDLKFPSKYFKEEKE